MNLDQLKQRIRIKMDTDPTEVDTYYDNFYAPLINECLSIVANTALPYQDVIEVKFGGRLEAGTYNNLAKDKYYRTMRGGTFIIDNETIECPPKSCIYYDTEWKYQNYNKYGYIVDIPYGLLSFSSETLPQYTNYFGDILMDADVIKLNDKSIALPIDGDYKIWYNSEYPEVTNNTDDDEKKELDFIPTNVLQLIPSYVASQLMMSEDMQRAMIYKNEFETMLARLDDNKPLQSYNIKNRDGWTL